MAWKVRESVRANPGSKEVGASWSVRLEAEDGRYTIALQRVVYVKRYARESRVGFGAAAS